jgi:hypothetical protein
VSSFRPLGTRSSTRIGPVVADTTTAAFQRINVEVYQPQNVQTSLFNNTLPPPLNPRVVPSVRI